MSDSGSRLRIMAARQHAEKYTNIYYKLPGRPGRGPGLGPGLGLAGPAAAWYFAFISYILDILWIYLDILFVYVWYLFGIFLVYVFGNCLAYVLVYFWYIFSFR